MKKKVALIIASKGYQPVEYGIPKTILEQSDYQVVTISDKLGLAHANNGCSTPVDVLLADADAKDYAGIFFIGGPGAMDCLDNEMSYELIQDAMQAHMPLGAICVAPRILARAGALEGMNATGWDDHEVETLADVFNEHGVTLIDQDVVVDDQIVTAVGPKAAKEFGETILALLKNNC